MIGSVQACDHATSFSCLRQYFPKGIDLSSYSQADLDKVAEELNGRPRQTLGWKEPIEVLNEISAEHSSR
jgi:transposase, IS30 family